MSGWRPCAADRAPQHPPQSRAVAAGGRARRAPGGRGDDGRRRRAHAVLARARRGRGAGRRRRPGERDRRGRGSRPSSPGAGARTPRARASPTAIPRPSTSRRCCRRARASRARPRRYIIGLREGERGVRAQIVVADPREPLHRHEAKLEAGRAPTRPDEVLISPSLADRISRRHRLPGPPRRRAAAHRDRDRRSAVLHLVRADRRAARLARRAAGRGRGADQPARPTAPSTSSTCRPAPPPRRCGPRSPSTASGSRRATPTCTRTATTATAEPGAAEPARHRDGHADLRPRACSRSCCWPAPRSRSARAGRRASSASWARAAAAPATCAASCSPRASSWAPSAPCSASRSGSLVAVAGRPLWEHLEDGRIVELGLRPVRDRRRRADRPALRSRRRRHPGRRRRTDAARGRARRALPDEPLGAPAHGHGRLRADRRRGAARAGRRPAAGRRLRRVRARARGRRRDGHLPHGAVARRSRWR